MSKTKRCCQENWPLLHLQVKMSNILCSSGQDQPSLKGGKVDNFVGEKLGNYRLTRLLGVGGFAAVYLGEHIYLKTQAAIKVLRVSLDDEALTQFLTEARTIAHLEHPNIVRTLEFGVQGSTAYLVMSYAPNGTVLRRYPRGSLVPLHMIIQYVRQIADALQYAHAHELIR